MECFYSRPARMQIYLFIAITESVYKRKSSTPTGLVWDTNMAALLFFWDTNMADMTLCEKAPLLLSKAIILYSR